MHQKIPYLSYAISMEVGSGGDVDEIISQRGLGEFF